MCSNQSGRLKACWVIDSRFEREGCDRTNARCSHQKFANWVLARHGSDALLHQSISIIEITPDIQHGQECKGQRIIGLYDRPDFLIEAKTAEMSTPV